jgi:hypothetical protein
VTAPSTSHDAAWPSVAVRGPARQIYISALIRALAGIVGLDQPEAFDFRLAPRQNLLQIRADR